MISHNNPADHWKTVVLDNGMTAEVYKVEDNDPDLSYLGEFVPRKPSGGFYVDRSHGELISGDGAVLRKELTRASHHSLQYWIPGTADLLPHNPQNWSRVTQEDKQRAIEKHGSLEDAEYDYVVEDYERHCDYGDSWHCMGLSVEVWNHNTFIGHDSIWGVDSDSGENYLNELIRELAGNILVEAKVA